MRACLRSDRLRMRPWTLEDAPAALRIFGDERVTKWLGATTLVPDVDAQREMLRGIIAKYDDPGNAPNAYWAIERIADRQVVGGLILKRTPMGPPILEIGWHLIPEFWGNGYATEAARALVRHCFEELGLDELWALTMPGNTASAAVCRRLGMEAAGPTHDYYDVELDRHRLVRPG